MNFRDRKGIIMSNIVRNLKISRRDFLKFGALTLSFPMFAYTPISAYAEDLTKDQITERIKYIQDSYGIGEVLSDEDARFMETYAFNRTRNTSIVNGSKYHNGHTYSISGNKYLNPSNDSTGTYGGTIQAGCSTSTSSVITLKMHVVVYALTGASYTPVHDNTVPRSGYNRQWFTSDFYGSYAGAFSLGSQTVWAEITIPDGQTIVVNG